METETLTLDEQIKDLDKSFLDKVKKTLSEDKMSDAAKSLKIEHFVMDYRTDKLGLTTRRY